MSAAERAADAVWDGFGPDGFAAGDGPTVAEVVAALMADPALLVDLAIEAGGLEPWGAWLTAARCNHDAREWCPVKEHTETTLFRRTTQENDRP